MPPPPSPSCPFQTQTTRGSTLQTGEVYMGQRQTGPEILRRYWYWYFLWPWTETDTDTDTQTWSTSRPILILIPWKCTGTDTDTDTLLNKNSAKTLQKMLRPLDRYRYWYRDSRNHWIETDTDTSCLGIGTIDTIPIFPSVSAHTWCTYRIESVHLYGS